MANQYTYISEQFTGVATGADELVLSSGRRSTVTYGVALGGGTGTVDLEYQPPNSTDWFVHDSMSADTLATLEMVGTGRFRLVCSSFTGGTLDAFCQVATEPVP